MSAIGLIPLPLLSPPIPPCGGWNYFPNILYCMSDDELQEFCQWYSKHFGKSEYAESVFVTCLCGHFHSYPKAMREAVNRMAALGLIRKEKDNITIV